MKDAHFYVYNIGHGVCTLLTGKKNDSTPYCGVFDCGTMAEHADCSLESIIWDMREKILNSGSRQIDYVVISHQDSDHWNLLERLLFKLNGITETKDGSIFRTKDSSWACKINTKDLYIISNNTYIKTTRSILNNYYYKVEATYKGATNILSSFELYIKIEKEYEELELFVELNRTYDLQIDDYYTKIDLNFPVSVDSIIQEVISNHLSDEQFLIPLYDIYHSFTTEARQNLFQELMGCEQIISIPIKRVIVGGDRISYQYEELKTLLSSMARYYGGDDSFLCEQCGAYITMNAEIGITGIQIENFPSIATVQFNNNNDAILRNLTSVVVQFNIDYQNVLLLPGDVTVHAFTGIANQIAEIPVNTLKLFLAPHHGSDHTNFADEEFEPLIYLFKIIQQLQSQCNLVISGYNERVVHPGERFTNEALRFLGNYQFVHLYAWASNLRSYMPAFTSIIDEWGEWPEMPQVDDRLCKRESSKRIFTTNLLKNNKYYVWCNGDIAGDSVPVSASTRNSTRKLPPDDSFL